MGRRCQSSARPGATLFAMGSTDTARPSSASEERPRRVDPRLAQTQRLVKEATLDLIAEIGFEGTTVELIAERSGVSRTTIYRHWPDPSRLLLEAFDPTTPDRQPPALTGDFAVDIDRYIRARRRPAQRRAVRGGARRADRQGAPRPGVPRRPPPVRRHPQRARRRHLPCRHRGRHAARRPRRRARDRPDPQLPRLPAPREAPPARRRNRGHAAQRCARSLPAPRTTLSAQPADGKVTSNRVPPRESRRRAPTRRDPGRSTRRPRGPTSRRPRRGCGSPPGA